MTIKTERRNVEGPDQMALIVDAIRNGDGDAAALAATRHVEKASSIARRLLEDRVASEEAALPQPALRRAGS